MKILLYLAGATALACAPALASAQTVSLPQIKNAGGANVPAQGSVLIGSDGTEKGTAANPVVVTGGGGGGSTPTGSAGSPNANVVTVQGVAGAIALPVSSTPVAYGSSPTSVTIAAANTFQSILAANPNRRGCVITSKSSAAFTVFTGPPGSATASLSFDVLPGQSFSCTSGGIVISDQLSAASATANSNLLVVTQ